MAVSRNLCVVLLAVLLSHCARTGLSLYDDCEAGEIAYCEVDGTIGTRTCSDLGSWGACTPAAGSVDAGARGGAAGQTGLAGSAGAPPVFGGQGGVGGVGQGALASGGAGSNAGGSGAMGGQVSGGSGGVSGSAGDGGSAGSSGGAPAVTCEDGAELELYVLAVIDGEYRLVQLDPETLELVSQVQLNLPNLNSMAMTRDGMLFLGARSGEIYTVDPISGATQQTPFDPAPDGFTDGFCIGWANSLPQAAQGALLISRPGSPAGQEIHSLDPGTFQHAPLGLVDTERLEIEGDEQGRLFALATADGSARIIQVDSSSFQVVDEVALPGTWSAFDIAYAGALYIIGGGSSALAYRMSVGAPLQDQPLTELGQLDFPVIGAGARVCP